MGGILVLLGFLCAFKKYKLYIFFHIYHKCKKNSDISFQINQIGLICTCTFLSFEAFTLHEVEFKFSLASDFEMPLAKTGE